MGGEEEDIGERKEMRGGDEIRWDEKEEDKGEGREGKGREQ
jgi:hypothetical protein